MPLPPWFQQMQQVSANQSANSLAQAQQLFQPSATGGIGSFRPGSTSNQFAGPPSGGAGIRGTSPQAVQNFQNAYATGLQNDWMRELQSMLRPFLQFEQQSAQNRSIAEGMSLGNYTTQLGREGEQYARAKSMQDMLLKQLTGQGGNIDSPFDEARKAAIDAAKAQQEGYNKQLQQHVFGTGQDGTTIAGDKARELALQQAAVFSGIESDFAKNEADWLLKQQMMLPQLFGMASSIGQGFGTGGGAQPPVFGAGGMGGGGMTGMLASMMPQPNNVPFTMPTPVPQQMPQKGNFLDSIAVTAPSAPPRVEAGSMFAPLQQGGGNIQQLLQMLMQMMGGR